MKKVYFSFIKSRGRQFRAGMRVLQLLGTQAVPTYPDVPFLFKFQFSLFSSPHLVARFIKESKFWLIGFEGKWLVFITLGMCLCLYTTAWRGGGEENFIVPCGHMFSIKSEIYYHRMENRYWGQVAVFGTCFKSTFLDLH